MATYIYMHFHIHITLLWAGYVNFKIILKKKLNDSQSLPESTMQYIITIKQNMKKNIYVGICENITSSHI